MFELTTRDKMLAGDYAQCVITTFDSIVGKTPKAIFFLDGGCALQEDPKYAAKVLFVFTDQTFLLFEHDQSCCETVEVEDVAGDLSDLIGSPLLLAEEVTGNGRLEYDDAKSSVTWTFYRFGTAKGDLSIRWWGNSNGYYSERVDHRMGNLSFDGSNPTKFIEKMRGLIKE